MAMLNTVYCKDNYVLVVSGVCIAETMMLYSEQIYHTS